MTELEAANELIKWCLWAGFVGLILIPFFISNKK